MRSIFTSLVLCIIAISISLSTYAQHTNPFWSLVQHTEILSKTSSSEKLLPAKFSAYTLQHIDSLKSRLGEAPLRFSDQSNERTVIISLPMPDGNFENFSIFASPVMSPVLAKKFPNIKTYSAAGITNPSSVAKLELTPKGFHAMIFAAGQNPIFVDPVPEQEQIYIAYFKKDFRSNAPNFECAVSDFKGEIQQANEIITLTAGDCQLREYRLALACTGEYAQYHDDNDDTNGDIVDDAMAAMVVSMDRVNGVFERDAGITMVMVDNNDQIIFTDPGTDPYTNGNGGAMLGQNQTTCDAEIGSANYDIGHVFSTGGGGVAYLNAPCNNSIKAGGVTGRNTPEGDPFDIDYVAHEMGHQFGGRHTQNNSCNRDNTSSYEPGSASTIMGYAGICSPNVQSNSDDYYHAISLQQFGNFTTGAGNSCANIINSGNNQPTANAGANYTIPISTPFVLTGIGTDSDADPLTYCWEQWDKEVATMPPLSTSTVGPAFRTFQPNAAPERYFPRLSVVAANGTATWEVLPSVSRDLNFRLTVRDNNNAYGCTEEDDMTVTSTASSGPFLVTTPNIELDWVANATETVTWDVANTTAAPVSCANVDILYSTDGGLSFPFTLVTNIPNNGSYNITVPDLETSQFRIMVKCSDNIFFDMSDENISIGVQTVCVTFNSIDVPVTIPANGTPIVTSDLSVILGETISDINVLNLQGTHTWIGDLRFTLIDPIGNEVVLINGECGNDDDFDINLDDSGGNLSCPYDNDQTTMPVDNLSSFHGNDSDGTWVLEIADLANQDGGQLDSWSLEVCYEEANGPLPLELLSFSAKEYGDEIVLNWETTNEINNRGFEIFRSSKPEEGFEYIGWEDGYNTLEKNDYTFTDSEVHAGIMYYYRLKQIDLDGQFTFSQVVQARLSAAEIQLEIAPNPANDQINVFLSKDGRHSGNIRITDIFGKAVKFQTFEMADELAFRLDLTGLPAGVYLLALNLDKAESGVQRFIKK